MTTVKYPNHKTFILGAEYITLLQQICERSHQTQAGLLRGMLDREAGKWGLDPVGYIK